MSRYHYRLLENAILFLREAVADLASATESDDEEHELVVQRNKAIIHMHIAAELMMKEAIYSLNWQDVFEDAKKADRDLFRSGNFKSRTYNQCIKYLKPKSIFFKKDLALFDRLGKQRNKACHFAHKIPIRSVQSLIRGVSRALLSYLKKNKITSDQFEWEINEIEGWLPLCQ
jgi:hypothetical protein